MHEPQTYGAALCLMIAAMLCWGSWANTMKFGPSWPFQLFYWDYVIGLLLITVVAGFTLGSIDDSVSSFGRNLAGAEQDKILYGLAAGAVFNVANLLLVAAISIAPEIRFSCSVVWPWSAPRSSSTQWRSKRGTRSSGAKIARSVYPFFVAC